MRTAPGRLAFAFSLALLVALASSPARAAGQLPDASAVTLGLAGSASATARGLTALSMNPAGLGMPGAGFSLALLPIQLRAGMHPITIADLGDYEGVIVPAAVKEDWLARATEEGAQAGDAGVDVSPLALAVGRFGFQLSTIAVATMSMEPAVLELVLFGNAGRTGEPTDLTLGGSEATGFAVTTASASMGFPLALAGGSMAIGATLKYSVGHVVAAGREQPGSVTDDELDVTFPIVATAEDADGLQNGAGVGLDLGWQLERGRLGLGAAVLNLFSTFSWDEEKLAFRPGTVFVDLDGSTTEFDEQPFDDAPDALVEAVDDLGFVPIVAVGGSYRATEGLTVSADLRKRFGDGLAREPGFHVGVGAEYDALQALRLRGGVAAVTGGVQLAAGTSVALGPVHLSLAGALRRGDRDANLGQLTVSFGGR